MTRKVYLFLITILLISESLVGKPDDSNLIAKQNAITKIPINDGDTLSIQELMTQKGLKGLSVAVFEDYKIIWVETWGVKYDTVLLDLNTAFSTASISKPITATLCAILEEKGLIDLTIPVNNYLKRWKIPDNQYTLETEVTLEHLLSHTAGTTQHGFTDFYEGDKIPSIVESVQGKLPRYNEEISFIFKPGSNWKYSGGGYTVAMMALEDHLGKSLAELAQEYIFTPLNMQNTTMKQPNENGFLDNVAKAHDEQGRIIKTGVPITPQVSASGMWSTPTDMSIFLIEIQKALNGQKTEVISEKVAKRITNIVTLKVMRGWSLGWERRYGYGNLDWFSHGGANTGIGGHIYATMKEGKGIVILGNGPNSVRIPIIDKFRDNIIRTHQWGKQLEWKNVQELPDLLSKRVKGRYQDINFGEVFEIKELDGKLYVPKFWNGVRNNLIYIGDDAFITNEIPGKFKFIHANEGVKIQYSRGSQAPPEVMYKEVVGKLPYEIALENNYSEALSAYQSLKSNNPQSYMVQESTINSFGYQQLGQKKYDIAILIFKINTELYPSSANTFDSLGEAYMVKGDTLNAIKYYNKSLELNPNNNNAKEMIDKMNN